MSSSTNAPAESKRAEIRQRSFIAATISYNNGLSSHDCIIRDISPEGARLKFSLAVALPKFFHLSIPGKGKQLYAEMKWRSSTEIGVAFHEDLSGSTLYPAAPEKVEEALRTRIHELEVEVARLKSRIAQLTDGAI